MTPAAADPEWQMLSQKQKNRTSEDIIKKVAESRPKLVIENSSQSFLEVESLSKIHEEYKNEEVEYK